MSRTLFLSSTILEANSGYSIRDLPFHSIMERKSAVLQLYCFKPGVFSWRLIKMPVYCKILFIFIFLFHFFFCCTHILITPQLLPLVTLYRYFSINFKFNLFLCIFVFLFYNDKFFRINPRIC